MSSKFCLALVLSFVSFLTSAQDPFVTVWNTHNPGISSGNQIVIPGTGTDYDISWELVSDPMVNGSQSGNDVTTVTFTNSGIYRVSITPGEGTFHRIHFDYLGDAQKLVTIEQWGDIQWSTMRGAFAGCDSMNCTAMDAPDLSNVTDLSYMFAFCGLFNGPIGTWDVSGVSLMSGMFSYTKSFNQPIGDWNVSAVTDMDSMFLWAEAFNQDIRLWDVSNVTSMRFMFFIAHSFNQPIGNWYPVNVVDMHSMFYGATAFNQYLGSWPLSPSVDMEDMLDQTGMSCENYDITLQFWATEPGVPANRVLGAESRTYWLSSDARNHLVTTKGWTINDDSFEECNYGSFICHSSTITLQEDDFVNGIYLLPASSVVDNASGYEVTIKRMESCIDFDWTTEGACIDMVPDGVTNEYDLGVEHRVCLPISQCDTEIEYEVRFIDQELGNWVFHCTGILTIEIEETVFGCTNLLAHNYNEDATDDDGSCQTCYDGVKNGDEVSIDCGGNLCSPCEVCSLPDREAMIAIFNALNGQNWLTPWDTTTCYCDWAGIACDDGQRVTEIILSGGVTGLSGFLPMEIGALTELRVLIMSNFPNLTDTIPASLGNLTKLVHLEIIDCGLTGTIPAAIGNLSGLWELRLDNNNLSGSLPQELSGIMNPELHTLRLDGNNFSGCFPIEYEVFCVEQLVYKEFSDNPGLPNGGDFAAFCETGTGGCNTCSDGMLNGEEEGIDCGGNCNTCPSPTASCGVITVYVDPNAPVYDGPGNNNIWWIQSELLDVGSTSAYEFPSINVRRHLSNLTFDWTTQGACIDANPNGGGLNNADKGTAYRSCLPVRNADFNVWKIYQLQIQDPAGSDNCIGTCRVIPQVGVGSTVIHYVLPDETEVHKADYSDEETSDRQLRKGIEAVISPNPGGDRFRIEWVTKSEEKMEIQILDFNGCNLYNLPLDAVQGENVVEIDTGNLLSGVYFVEVKNSNDVQIIKWIKS